MDMNLKKYIDSAFNSKGTRNFKDIPDKTRMYVYGFKYVELTKYGEACILMYSFDKELTNSALELIYAPSNIKKYLDKIKIKCTESIYKKEQRYAKYDKSPIITIEKDGYYFNSMNNKCPKVNIISNKCPKDKINENPSIEKPFKQINEDENVKSKYINAFDD